LETGSAFYWIQATGCIVYHRLSRRPPSHQGHIGDIIQIDFQRQSDYYFSAVNQKLVIKELHFFLELVALYKTHIPADFILRIISKRVDDFERIRVKCLRITEI
jgi:hypothetical protein